MSTQSKIAVHTDRALPVKAMTYNINRAVAAEELEATCWKNRRHKIISMIEKHNPSILCLQECRKLDDSDARELMHSLQQYNYSTTFANGSSLSLALIIAYKMDEFFCVDSGMRWLSSTPNECSDSWGNGWGRVMSYMHLQPIVDGKLASNKRLVVFNTHLGLGEEEKNKSVALIPQLMKEIAGPHPAILMGDFNFFYDMNGAAQEKAMTMCESYPLQHWTGAYVNQYDTSIESTFFPYTYEKMYKELLEMKKRALDHVYTRGLEQKGTARVDTSTMSGEEPRDMMPNSTPSDHVPVIVEFDL